MTTLVQNQDRARAGQLRRMRQWLLAPVMLVTIGFGWKYTWLGFAVPVAMAAGIFGGLFRGRYVCGNLCPRGSFFDRVLTPLGFQGEIPPLLRSRPLRWMIFVGMMSLMTWQLARNPGDPAHWGFVFWGMCTVTTLVGIALAVALHPRTWCALCPIGTLSSAIGGSKYPLVIDSSCRECGRCEQSCTLNLPIVRHKAAGASSERDCLKCSVCIETCPRGALSWPDAT